MTAVPVGGFGEDRRHLERAGGVADEHETGEQHETSGRRDEQRLEGRGASRRTGVLDADQQVRRNRGQLPRREHRDQVVGDDDSEHRPGEQREQAGEAVDAVSVADRAVEVPPRVGEDGDADEGDDEDHDGTEGVESHGDLDAQGRNPGQALGDRFAVEQPVELRHQPGEHRQRRHRGDEVGTSPERPAGDDENQADDGVEEDERNQQDVPLVVGRPRAVIRPPRLHGGVDLGPGRRRR